MTARQFGFCILLASSFFLPLSGLAARAQVGLTPVDYVIHISVDGLRGDVLQRLVADNPTTYPNFYRLQTEGAYTYNGRSDYFYTETVPNHISMITGRPVNQPAGADNTVHHGYSNNFPGGNDTIHATGNPNVAYKQSTFDVAHDHGLTTALYTSKTRLAILDRSYDASHGAADTIGEDNGTDKIDTSMLVDGSSAGIVSALASQLETTPANYTFLHLVEPDTVGHRSGWENASWYASVQTIDQRLASLFAAIDDTAQLSGRTAIVLTGDHGGGVDIHREATAYVNYNVPLFVWGAGLPANTNLYDLPFDRVDPGLERPEYGLTDQPWRNGDTGNLAMMALGLNAIPNSFMVPQLVPEPATFGSVLLTLGLCLLAKRPRR